MQTTLKRPATCAAADAQRSIASASKHPTRSVLDRAIAAAEAFLPEYERVNAAHSAAEVALPRWDEAVHKRGQAARAAIIVPSELCFTLAPADQLVKMEMTYVDGSVRTVDQIRQGYSLDTRDSLLEYCSQKGLDTTKYLAIWDDWRARQDAAEDAAKGPEALAAEASFERAEKAWERALTKRRRLAADILKAPVNSAEDALAQIEAYRRIEEITDLAGAFEEDKTVLLETAIRALTNLAGSPEPQRLAA